jgi:hypothetical protein
MFKTIEWTDDGVRMIDQTRLPGEEVYRTDDGGKTWRKVNETLAGGRGGMPTGTEEQAAPGEDQGQQPPSQGRGGQAQQGRGIFRPAAFEQTPRQ